MIDSCKALSSRPNPALNPTSLRVAAEAFVGQNDAMHAEPHRPASPRTPKLDREARNLKFP